jgi:hypothetical protein
MRFRTPLIAGLIGSAAVAGFFLFRAPVSVARPAAPNPETAATKLPVKQVVLFSSGVGYFQRQGEVEGDARVDLSFPAGDINDLLKSLTLQDLNGGLVTAVSYDSHDPVERTLKSFAVDLTGHPGVMGLLEQARGEKIEILLQQSAGQQSGTLSGTIVGVEAQKQAGKEGPEQVAFLNMWCADGLRANTAGPWIHSRYLTTRRRRRCRSRSAARASGRCASGMSPSRPSGRRATDWCSATRSVSRSSKVGRWSRTRRMRTGTACAWH